MSSRIVTFNPEARTKLIQGVNTLAKAVGTTLGPKGRNVVIDAYGVPQVTKDGVTVAKFIELEDPIERLGANIVKQAASKTATIAGDGTTTATVLTQALIQEGLELVSKGVSPIDIKRGYETLLEETLQHLSKLSAEIKPDDSDLLFHIASISANNDYVTGGLIQEAYTKVGKEGLITVEDSKSNETYIKVVDGTSINKGYLSQYFITDTDRLETIFENPLIFITDQKIKSTQDIVPILEMAVSNSRPIVLIADEFEAQAVSMLVYNKLRTGLPVVAVKAPAYGPRRTEILQDLAILTGGEMISQTKAQRIADTKFTQLGSCQKVVVSQHETLFISPNGDPAQIEARAELIRAAMPHTDNAYDLEKLAERLANLVAKVAVLYVGAATETEVKEKKDRIDDALRAVKAAVTSGYVVGGGYALYDISTILPAEYSVPFEIVEAFKKALQYPTKLILNNAGVSHELALLNRPTLGQMYNPVTNEFCNFIDTGIIDPTLVVTEAIKNATSAASMILLSEVTVHDTTPKYSPDAGLPQE